MFEEARTMKIHFKTFELLDLAEGMSKSLHGRASDADLTFILAKIQESKQALSVEPLRPSDCRKALAPMRMLAQLAQPHSEALEKLFKALEPLLEACEAACSEQLTGKILEAAAETAEMPQQMRDFLRIAAQRAQEGQS